TGGAAAALAVAGPHAAPSPPVVAGQQAYVYYRLGMVAKVDALEQCRASRLCVLVVYDAFGSDRLFSCTDLPSVNGSRDPLLSLHFHPGKRAHAGKDLRFVPLPDGGAMG